jgi:hypothetical protein
MAKLFQKLIIKTGNNTHHKPFDTVQWLLPVYLLNKSDKKSGYDPLAALQGRREKISVFNIPVYINRTFGRY